MYAWIGINYVHDRFNYVENSKLLVVPPRVGEEGVWWVRGWDGGDQWKTEKGVCMDWYQLCLGQIQPCIENSKLLVDPHEVGEWVEWGGGYSRKQGVYAGIGINYVCDRSNHGEQKVVGGPS